MAAGMDRTVGRRRHHNQLGRSVGGRIAGTAVQTWRIRPTALTEALVKLVEGVMIGR